MFLDEILKATGEAIYLKLIGSEGEIAGRVRDAGPDHVFLDSGNKVYVVRIDAIAYFWVVKA